MKKVSRRVVFCLLRRALPTTRVAARLTSQPPHLHVDVVLIFLLARGGRVVTILTNRVVAMLTYQGRLSIDIELVSPTSGLVTHRTSYEVSASALPITLSADCCGTLLALRSTTLLLMTGNTNRTLRPVGILKSGASATAADHRKLVFLAVAQV